MPLMKSKSSKALKKNMETEMDADKPKDQALAIAYSVQRKNKSKKMMADGGTVGDAIGYPKADDSAPLSMMADGGMLAEEDSEMKHASLAAAIMAKRAKAKMMAEGGMVDLQANSNEDLNLEDDLSFDAARKDTYSDLSQLDEQPMDSNEKGDDIEADAHDMVSSIRKKMRAKRGL